MSERQTGPYDTIARRWLALVERRQEHFIELCQSGRWRHYYTQAEFLAEMRKVLRLRDKWAVLGGLPVSDAAVECSDEDLLAGDLKKRIYRNGRAPRQLEFRTMRDGGQAIAIPDAVWPD